VGEAEERLREVPSQRDATVGRLEPDDPAVVRRQPDRAAEVAAEPERRHAGGDGHRLAAARAAGAPQPVVRIRCAPEDEVRRLPPERELGRVRLSQQNGAGGLRTRDDRRVPLGDEAGEEPGAARGPDAGGVERVLDRERDAVQRTELVAAQHGRLRRARPLLRVGCLGHDRVQRRIEAVDAALVLGERLDR
jgi:hypothetical protein